MNKGVKIYIRHNDEWIDVTDKRVVIYGAGQGAQDMLNELSIPNVCFIVDENKSRHGQEILIQNKLFCILSPNILIELNHDEYYVVISSIQYKDEIQAKIRKLTNNKMISCVWNTEFRYCYKNIEDMFMLDPIINKKLFMLNLSFYVYEILNEFYMILKEIFSDIEIEYFLPIRQGASKLIFLFGNKTKMWVFSVRGKSTSSDKLLICKSENESYCKKAHFIRNYLKDSITVYRDDVGILIQKYAFEKVDYNNWDIRRLIIEKCREIHDTGVNDGLGEDCFAEKFYAYYRKQIQNCEEDIVLRIDGIVQECIVILNNSNKKHVIHGDLSCENIVMYNKEIVFIDWEYLSIGNPMIDVSYFLYSIHFTQHLKKKISFEELCKTCMTELPEVVKLYCKKKVEFFKYIDDAEAAMKVHIIRNMLDIYLKNSSDGMKNLKFFIDYITD